MGYRAEKEQEEKKQKIALWIILAVVAVLVVGICIFAAFVPPDTWTYYVRLPKVAARRDGELKIHFLDVGQGDATFLELPDGKTMLIDGGDGSPAATKSILRFLNARQVETLDYLLVTHADSDHCGGLARIMQLKKVKKAYIPTTLPEENVAYAKFYATMIASGCSWEYSSRTSSIESKNDNYPYTLKFLYPYEEMVDPDFPAEVDDNEFSAVCWLDYQGVSALFTGDIPASVEGQLLRDDKLGLLAYGGIQLDSTEILKVAHHGSADSTGAEFLSHLNVETAVISCGVDNAYGHPTETVLGRLNLAGVTAYRTDLNGHISVTVSPNGTYQTSCLGK